MIIYNDLILEEKFLKSLFCSFIFLISKRNWQKNMYNDLISLFICLKDK